METWVRFKVIKKKNFKKKKKEKDKREKKEKKKWLLSLSQRWTCHS